MRRLRFAILLGLLGACTSARAPEPAPAVAPSSASLGATLPAGWVHRTPPAPGRSNTGMVSTDTALATRVGVDVLAAGGNAMDAAVATYFALAVVFPEAGNVGGGGFMVYRGADGTEAALDFRETAPAASTRDMYIDERTGKLGDKSLRGVLAAGVPGAVDGMWRAHQRFGSKPWAEMLAPAIRLAADGFVVNAPFAEGVARRADALRRYEGTRALYFPDGQPVQEGSRLQNPELAAVLERIQKDGPAGFYKGPTAELIVAEMARGKGIMTLADLAAYESKWRDPVAFEYRGHRVLAMPPPSSGGLVLALVAGATRDVDISSLGFHSVAHVHRVAETMRHAFARRNALLGDSDFVDVPFDAFTSKEAAQSVMAAFDEKRATPSRDVDVGVGRGPEGDHTTHFSVVDAAGSAVAITTTINTSYGSGVVVQGGGFFLNNEMDDFASQPGQPNVYGLVQGDANAIQPHKRPLSSMSPTIVLDPEGKVRLVVGAAGGPTIITAVYQIMSNVIDFGMDVPAAVAAPRVHHQHLPDQLFFEKEGLPEDVVTALEALGHAVGPSGWPIGDAPSLAREGEGWVGAVEVRQTGASAAGP